MDTAASYIPIIGSIVGGLIAASAGMSTALYMFKTQVKARRRALALSLVGEQLITATRLLRERSLLDAGSLDRRESGAAIIALRSNKTPDRFVLRHVAGELGILGPKTVYHLMELELGISQLDEKREGLQKLHYVEEGADPGYSKNLLPAWNGVSRLLATSLCSLAKEIGESDKIDERLLEYVPKLVMDQEGASLDPMVSLEPMVLSLLAKARTPSSAIDSSGWTGIRRRLVE
jgi:hypothetical protein